MAGKRTQNEAPPADWVPTQAVDHPILNSPYVEPTLHWVYHDGLPSKTPGRRPASYWFKTKKIGAAQSELFKEESRDDLPLVNALREDVKRWRGAAYRGATAVTKDLLIWWTREDKPRRLFFCQREAVETIIYLLELAIPGRLRATGFQNFKVDSENIGLLLRGEMPTFEHLSEDFFPRLTDPPAGTDSLPLRRLGCKMATGSGKTIVMAMLIAWAFCNRGFNPSSSHFPNAVLVCAPNLTIKKRLQVLRPEDPANYYDAFDLIPQKYREHLNAGKVLVTNWHVFAPKSEHSEGGKTYAVVNKGEESDDAFAKDRLGELAARLPILVLNDEGHHCWRAKVLSEAEKKAALKDRSKEEQSTLEEEAEEARVWLSGLDRINNSGLLGKDDGGKPNAGITACVDLSATPFYLANSGYPEGSPFPWLVSDFGLVDAIESGITKIPRLPVRDDKNKKDEVGRPDPAYFRLWETIKGQLKPGDYISKGKPKPEAVYKYAEAALVTLAAQWRVQYKKCKEDAAGSAFVPPVLIVVCDNTEIAEVFYRQISGEREYETTDENGKTITCKRYDPSTVLPELVNSDIAQHTIRIDSKLLAKIETEGDESRDEAALRLRELIDTVGKRGGSGEQVRCIVSVSMLTEGWDANNVTHVLGVRAFGSQLLCEQVVGRGLRRTSYTPDPDTGLLNAEFVDVYGIPFSLIPFKGKPKDDPPNPDPVYHSIYAMHERAGFEIRMPNVEGFVYALREGGITCNVDKLEGFVVDKQPTTVFLMPVKGYLDDPLARPAGTFVAQTREEYYKSVRLQQLLFTLAQLILEDLMQGATGEDRGRVKYLARHQLFPEILKIIKAYVQKKVVFKGGVDPRELGLKQYADALRERIRDNILPVVVKENPKLLPILNRFKPFTSTANVNYQTTRPVVALEKSHLNRAMLRSSWERHAIEILEDMDVVECFCPNDRQIGLLVPYEYDGQPHNYEPDFFVRLKNNSIIMLEIKGPKGKIHDENQVLAKNGAAKKWVVAVNNLKKYGAWHFEICEEIDKLRGMVERHCPTYQRPFRNVDPEAAHKWQDSVPLVSLLTLTRKHGEIQQAIDILSSSASSWVTWDSHPTFAEGMFVSRIRGSALEPDMPDGSYCLFRLFKGGSAQGKTVVASHAGIRDPNTIGKYTVRVYETEARGPETGDWEHVRIYLKATNPEVPPFVIEAKSEAEVNVIAELLEKVG